MGKRGGEPVHKRGSDSAKIAQKKHDLVMPSARMTTLGGTIPRRGKVPQRDRKGNTKVRTQAREYIVTLGEDKK